jgi:Na+-translocating ferredoxin:NAD+ oxidoreductase RnfC subunit
VIEQAMSEQDIEIPHEHVEHAKHAAEHIAQGDRLTRDAAIAVALMAIVAATIGSLQETESAKALGLKNESVLLQSKASDQWSFFQAKSIKKNAYQIAAEQARMAGQDSTDFAAKAQRYAGEENDIQTGAKHLEEQSQDRWHDSDHHSHRQHVLTLAVTLVHVGIAISSLALFTRRRAALNGALALSFGGIAVALFAYLA